MIGDRWTVYRLEPGRLSSVIAHASNGHGQLIRVLVPRRTMTRAEITAVVQLVGDRLIAPPTFGKSSAYVASLRDDE